MPQPHQFKVFDEQTRPGLKALQNLYLYSEIILGIPARTDDGHPKDRKFDPKIMPRLQKEEGQVFKKLSDRIGRTLVSIEDAVTTNHPDVERKTIDEYLEYVVERARNKATEMATGKRMGYDGGSSLLPLMDGLEEQVGFLLELPEPWIHIHPNAEKGIKHQSNPPQSGKGPQRGR